MIKTAQFIDTYYPVIDGVIGTVKNYAEFFSKDSYCCVVAPREKGYKDSGNFEVIRTAGIKIPKVGYTCATPKVNPATEKMIKDKQLDLLHAHSPFMMGSYALYLGKKLDLPVVATFHTKFYDDFKRITKSELIAEQMTDVVVRFFKKADVVWAVNRATGETLRSYGYKGDITVMPNGTDFEYPSNIAELAARAAEEYSVPRDKKILMFTGHLIWQKNLKVIIDTLALLKKKRNDFCMIFAGEGYNAEEIIAYAHEMGVDDVTKFIGQVSNREMLAGIYSLAQLFFFPSIYDNAPLVLREAAAMHLPALLAEGSNSVEGIMDGINGFVEVPRADAMCEKINDIFNNESQLVNVGINAANTIPVSWATVTKRVQKEYAEICARYKANVIRHNL